MKTSSKLTLIFLTCAAGSAFGQDGSPNCAVTNYDQSRNAFTVINATPGAINQQCFLTIHPAGAVRTNTPGIFREGTYEITLSGGGGGGGGGSTREGGGGGGAGALPFRTVQYLQPGVYRMTLGTGGQGGPACVTAVTGGRGTDGNPTSLSEAYSGMTIAGFPRAEYWAGQAPATYQVASAGGGRVQVYESIPNAIPDGDGGTGIGGQSSGGDGGHTHRGQESRAQDGTRLAVGSWPGLPGKGGNSFDRSTRLIYAGGGGGGAGYGNGGDGQSAGFGGPAKPGELGAGGGGGAGNDGTCGVGASGGHGFIKMAMLEPAPAAAVTPEPSPQVVVVRERAPDPEPMVVQSRPEPAPAPEMRPARRDRN